MSVIGEELELHVLCFLTVFGIGCSWEFAFEGVYILEEIFVPFFELLHLQFLHEDHLALLFDPCFLVVCHGCEGQDEACPSRGSQEWEEAARGTLLHLGVGCFVWCVGVV